jgi:nucleoside-diphosphate-sugar epimerase
VKVLVTGGGGFVGRSIARALASRGEEVRTFARGNYPALAAEGIEHIRGDITDEDAVRRAVEGRELVFHTAAMVSAAGTPEQFEAVNIGGTDHVLRACREHAVAAFVHTSTPSVVFGHGDIEGIDESAPYAEQFEAEYPRTKAEAERRVLAADGEGLRTVCLRPHIVWGPGDTSLLPRLLERAPKLRRIGGPAKKTDQTYIDDAVQAHLKAATILRDDPDRIGGKAYFISSGHPVEIWPFINRMLEAAGRPPVTRTVPPRLALAAGWVFETVHRMGGSRGEPRLSRWIVREMMTSHWFDISAARRDLGYEPTGDVDVGMAALADWLASPQGQRLAG